MKFAFGSTAEKNGFPRIDRIAPAAAIPGGEIVIHGSGFASRTGARPVVHFGEAEASLVLATDNRLIARVPDNANDGTVHRVTPEGRAEQWIEGMGIATGIAFDPSENLYVGDRSGTIFKISPSREVFVFATLEPSLAAYHLAFHPSGDLYVTGPTTSSYDRVYRITQGGDVSVFYRGLGRPQGLAFDRDSNLYVAASHGGHRGIVRLTPEGRAETVLSGSGLVGLALQPSGRAILTTVNALFTPEWDLCGLPLVG